MEAPEIKEVIEEVRGKQESLSSRINEINQEKMRLDQESNTILKELLLLEGEMRGYTSLLQRMNGKKEING